MVLILNLGKRQLLHVSDMQLVMQPRMTDQQAPTVH